MQKTKIALSRLLNLIYPEHCGFCGREITYGKLVCPRCAKLVRLELCDGSIPEKYENAMFDGIFYAGIYEGITRDGMLRFKKGKARNAARYLSMALVKSIKASHFENGIDCIAYVPVSLRRKLRRGYDHAEVMAEIISEMLGVPIAKGVIRRKNSRKSQHSQRNFTKRRELARTVYTIPKKRKSLDGKIILLCDDIVTSGATLSKCADILKEQGADVVYAAALVRAGSGNYR